MDAMLAAWEMVVDRAPTLLEPLNIAAVVGLVLGLGLTIAMRLPQKRNGVSRH
jgi:hypothetical protein